MAERDPERRAAPSELWIGPGRQAREAAACLLALAGLDEAGEPRRAAPAALRLADLEELLAVRTLTGLLILEAARVPLEDIGFVRRFLERHPGRAAVVLGAEREEARALLALPRTSWLAWPPELEALRALWPPAPAVAAPRPAEATRAARARGPEASVPNGAHDLRALLEELLAGAVVLGGPRFHLRSGAACPVHEDRLALRAGLEGLLVLARACAGDEGLVRAALDPAEGGVRIGLDFPRAALPGKDLPGLLEPDAKVGEGPAEAARAGAERLRALGARVELQDGEPGRVRCEVRLGRTRPAQARPRAGKPEDPFA
ncbi:MAG TPA: hypothetical protein VF530_17865 [Planctomycetota bacterium]